MSQYSKTKLEAKPAIIKFKGEIQTKGRGCLQQ